MVFCVRIAIGSLNTEKKSHIFRLTAFLTGHKEEYTVILCLFYAFHVQLMNQVTSFHDAWCKRYEIGEHNAVSLFNFLQSLQPGVLPRRERHFRIHKWCVVDTYRSWSQWPLGSWDCGFESAKGIDVRLLHLLCCVGSYLCDESLLLHRGGGLLLRKCICRMQNVFWLSIW